MNILDLKIDWSPKFDNAPSVQILIDRIPRDLVYTDRHPFYFAEKDGFVSFFYYQKPGDGYAKRAFDIETDKGPKVLKGPWSSNSDAMRSAGFPDTISVSITDDPQTLQRGFTFFAGHILFEVIKEALKTHAPGCVFATVGGSRTIVKRNLLPYLANTQYPDMPRAGSPDLSEGQARIVGWDASVYNECGYRLMVSPTLYASPQWVTCTKPLGHEGLHIDFRSH